MIEPLLTVPEAARILRLGRSATYALVASGELASVRIGPRAVRIRAEALEQFIGAREQGGRA